LSWDDANDVRLLNVGLVPVHGPARRRLMRSLPLCSAGRPAVAVLFWALKLKLI
jgi:hypothetical protein